jgi:hypothetical protein
MVTPHVTETPSRRAAIRLFGTPFDPRPVTQRELVIASPLARSALCD